jgi:hypothetical protein
VIELNCAIDRKISCFVDEKIGRVVQEKRIEAYSAKVIQLDLHCTNLAICHILLKIGNN